MSQDDEICDYLRRNEVHKIFETLTGQLLHTKPTEPMNFMIDRLTKLKNAAIKDLRAREVLDSRGVPTLEVDLQNGNGLYRAVVPAGTTTGPYEAAALRDGEGFRYLGKGVQKAVQNVATVLAPELIGKLPTDQLRLDELMIKIDGSSKKSVLGSNTILAVSLAIARAAADIDGVPVFDYIGKLVGSQSITLPVPIFTMVEGGRHAGNQLPTQSYAIAPVGASSLKQAIQMGCEIYHALKEVLRKKYGADGINIGEEGGFAPPFRTPTEPLNYLRSAIQQAGYAGRIKICVDCAANVFYTNPQDDHYDLSFKSETGVHDIVSPEDLSDVYADWAAQFPIISIEDPFHADDFENFSALAKRLQIRGVNVVADDLTASTPDRVQRAVLRKACTGISLAPSQVGTISEALKVFKTARENGWSVIVAERAGETEDSFAADLAVGLGAGLMKVGAPVRGERTTKLNRLLRIEDLLLREGKPFTYGYVAWKQ